MQRVTFSSLAMTMATRMLALQTAFITTIRHPAIRRTPGRVTRTEVASAGRDHKVGTLEGKTSLPVPPLTLFCVLPEPTSGQAVSSFVPSVHLGSWAPPRPAQTLLRQHCALIV
jgi:hypothetical protein